MYITYQKVKESSNPIYLEWRDPNDGFRYQGRKNGNYVEPYQSVDDLISHIKERRAARDYPAFDDDALEVMVHNHICSTNVDQSICEKVDKLQTKENGLQAMGTLVEMLMSGERVTLNEATSNAYWCANCTYNTNNQGSAQESPPVGKMTEKAFQLLVKSGTTQYDNKINGGKCTACGFCDLKSKIFTSPEANIRKLSDTRLRVLKAKMKFLNGKQDHCWVIKKGMTSKDPAIKARIEKA